MPICADRKHSAGIQALVLPDLSWMYTTGLLFLLLLLGTMAFMMPLNALMRLFGLTSLICRCCTPIFSSWAFCSADVIFVNKFMCESERSTGGGASKW